MKDDVQQLREVLGPHDPASTVSIDEAKRATIWRRVETLGKTLSSKPAPSHWSRPRRLSGLVATAAVVAVIGIQVTPGLSGETPPAYAATPRPLQFQQTTSVVDARAQLLQLADVAGRQPSELEGGPVSYVKTQGWYLGTRVDGQVVNSAILPSVREMWRVADGSGRLKTQWGAPEFPDPDAKKAWQADGEPGTKPEIDDSHMQTNGLQLMVPNPSSSPDVLVQQLAASHPIEHGAAEQFVAVSDLYKEQPVPPAVRSAVLQVLSRIPDIRSLGSVTDRAERPGVAFAVDSTMSGLPTEYILIFDPNDGSLLSEEQMLTSDPGKLNVQIPAVTSYTLFLHADQRNSLN